MSDDWDFYFSQVENNPASILVDLGIHDDAPLPGLTELVYLRVRMRQPRDDGLSSSEEFARLSEIGDALEATCRESEAEIVYVGRNTSAGCRDFFFYAANAMQAESVLSSAMVPFSEYAFEIGTNPDPEWTGYFQFLYPSERQRQMILNGRVLANLEEHGDRHEIEREVCHWIHFDSAEDRARFLEAATSQGFQPIKVTHEADQPRPYGLAISRRDAVDYATINRIVLELFDLAGRSGGEYDGWETAVVKDA